MVRIHPQKGTRRMLFKNRSDAGRRLALALAQYKTQDPVVLALPRGGVPVAAEVAASLGCPLDLILVNRLAVPSRPELAMGAIAYGPGDPRIVRNEEAIRGLGVTDRDFAAACERELDELRRRRELYLQGREAAAIEDRVAIIVDDGIVTGATARAALEATRARRPKRLLLAVPVAPVEELNLLHGSADDIVCLERYETMGAIRVYYVDFRPVSDQDVIAHLDRFRTSRATRQSSVRH
jgi:predicted phosphoribosyltransferase